MKTAHPTKFSVTILGSNSALPANGRHPTSQLLNANNHFYLIDCGEGTQMQLRRYNLKMQRIKAIFISHMHGDHYFGLVGLLNSLHLLGRNLPLQIYAPPELKPIVAMQIDAAGANLSYDISFIDIQPFASGKKLIYVDEQLKVEAFNLKHRIHCYGFLFTEQERERSYLPEIGGPKGVKVSEIPLLKKGVDVVREDGSVLRHQEFTLPPAPPRTYAYCTDTLPLDSTSEHAKGANLLYHEATFLHDEQKRARETYHSTALQAAEIALRAGVAWLLLGHYSARYADLRPHLLESSGVFQNTLLAEEGKEIEII